MLGIKSIILGMAIATLCVLSGLLGVIIAVNEAGVDYRAGLYRSYFVCDSQARYTATDQVPTTCHAPLDIPIIAYHYVEYVHDPGDTIRRSLNINPDIFENQLRRMSDENYATYFVRDMPSLVDGQQDMATHSAVLTFDDGYEDFYMYAFPLLKKYNMRATIFIINNFLNRPGFLTDSQLETMRDSGIIEIGAHTMNHEHLASISEENARQEIVDSKNDLENRLGQPVESFAYPFGDYNPRVAELVDEAGYSAAVTMELGATQSEHNLLTLRRIRAGGFTGTNYQALISRK